jgi:hypothetical protein
MQLQDALINLAGLLGVAALTATGTWLAAKAGRKSSALELQEIVNAGFEKLIKQYEVERTEMSRTIAALKAEVARLNTALDRFREAMIKHGVPIPHDQED